MSEVKPITARNRLEFEEKIKETLKKDFPQKTLIDLKAFSEKYGIRPSNVKKVIEDLTLEGYELSIPSVGAKANTT